MKTRISWIFYCLVSFMLLPSLSAAERFVTNESNGFICNNNNMNINLQIINLKRLINYEMQV